MLVRLDRQKLPPSFQQFDKGLFVRGRDCGVKTSRIWHYRAPGVLSTISLWILYRNAPAIASAAISTSVNRHCLRSFGLAADSLSSSRDAFQDRFPGAVAIALIVFEAARQAVGL